MSNDTDKQTAENGSTASLPPNGDDGRGEAGRFVPGNPGGPGRPKGEPNRIGADLKADLWAAYQRRGGREWLEKLPPKVFAGLLAKLLPRESPTSAEPDAAAPEVNVQVLERIIGLLDAAAAAAGFAGVVDPDLRRLLVGRDAAGAGE